MAPRRAGCSRCGQLVNRKYLTTDGLCESCVHQKPLFDLAEVSQVPDVGEVDQDRPVRVEVNPDRPVRVLDLFCGARGSARGFADAGFEVTGVDISPMPRYLKSGAKRFIQADALDVLADREFMSGFDLGNASPPCQYYSAMSSCRPQLAEQYPNLIKPLRTLLIAWGGPFVIENVEAAERWMKAPTTLCAQMFGVKLLYRHRLFETGGGFVLGSPPQPPPGLSGARKKCGWPHLVPASKAGHWKPGTAMSVAGHVGNVGLARELMGIDWSTREELSEAIPPAYSRWVAFQYARWRGEATA